MGGMARRAAKINEARRQGIPTILVDGGDFSPNYNQQGEIKSEVLLESFRQMKYDAISIAEREMLMQNDNYNALEKLKSCGIPIVTLNIKYKGKRLREKPIIINREGIKVGAFGLFIGDQISRLSKRGWEIEDPEKIIKTALMYTRQNSDFVIAMLYGEMGQIRKFVKNHKGMDIVIISRSSSKIKKPAKINNSLLLSAGIQGKYLGRIDAYLVGRTWRFDPQLIALDKRVPEDPKLAATYAKYQKRIELMAKESAKKYAKELKDEFPPVHRAAACRSCHGDIYNKWAKTAHAHAIESLIKKNEHNNQECLGCHTTSYLKGGFISLGTTPEYAGVQCVSCHRKLKEHIEFYSRKPDKSEAQITPRARPPEVTQDVCLRCHSPEFDNDFDFDRDKKMVH